MRISELARASGESVSTIKFYIREAVLFPGESTAPNQAVYGDHHLKRLALIRTLREELNMSVERIREVILSAEQGGQAMLGVGLRAAQESLHVHKNRGKDKAVPELGRAWNLLVELSEKLGWQFSLENETAAEVAEAVATILRVMPEAKVEDSLIEYAKVMKAIADEEISDSFDPQTDPFESLRYAILGTYLFEPLILSLRRLAHGQRVHEIQAKSTIKSSSPIKAP